ncbi:hypothetical protein EV359DRAFT_47174 [Lentinula novae-zelandiae]|nr:hypothetical protein EV359DRAFT_47174 [Lentinula novae-zelandiae]
MHGGDRETHSLSQPIVTFYDRPGLFMPTVEQGSLIQELRAVAAASFCMDTSQLPNYQCLAIDDPSALSDKLIAVGRAPSTGCIIGFISSVLVQIPDFSEGEVLHVGLACLSPSSKLETVSGLAKHLMASIVYGYLLKNPSTSKVWVTNRSSNLSTLGRFAQTVDEVFPSPVHPISPPTSLHVTIANAIIGSSSRSLNVTPGKLDPRTFIVRKFLFHAGKEEDQRNDRYHYSNPKMWEFYRGYLDENGSKEDESGILQVGHISPRMLYVLRAIMLAKL